MSACNCCVEPPSTPPSVEYVSVRQDCTASNCGFLPCTSDTVNQCTPNAADLTPAEICAGKRYLTKTFTATDGHVETSTCVIDPENPTSCDCSTTCSGVVVDTHNEYYSSTNEFMDLLHDITTTSTKTYNNDCTTTIEETCEGENNQTVRSSDDNPYTLTCQSQISEDCSSYSFTETCTGGSAGTCDGWPISGSGWCWLPDIREYNIVDTYTTTPEPTETTTTEFADPNTTGTCFPQNMPAFPAFVDCAPDGEPEYPQLESGQAYLDEAFQFKNPNNPAIKSVQKVKFRISHQPSASCYLKVWMRKVIQSYKFEDCDTGFAGDEPRTPQLDTNCEAQPCFTRWSTNGPVTYEELSPYVWRGSGNPCFADTTKLFGACENKIYFTREDMTIEVPEEANQSITIDSKYSFVEGYEPNWPDETGSTGCKPNGFPQANQTGCE